MREGFVPLAQWLAPANASPEPNATRDDAPIEPAPSRDGNDPEVPAAIGEAMAEVRRFRAALADALDASLEQLLCDVAAEVVGRELLLAPADVLAIVRRACDRFAVDEPVAIRVHPDDCVALQGETAAIVADARLRRGDVVLEVTSGTIDARLGARLDALLTAFAAR